MRVFVGLIVFCCVSFLHAQEVVKLYVGAVPVQLGMPKDKVLSAIAQQGYNLTSVSNNGSRFIVHKSNSPPFAEIEFKNDALSYASRELAMATEADSEKLVVELHRLVAEYEASGNTKCLLGTSLEAAEGFYSRGITIQCGRRAIELRTYTVKGTDGPATQLQEHIE